MSNNPESLEELLKRWKIFAIQNHVAKQLLLELYNKFENECHLLKGDIQDLKIEARFMSNQIEEMKKELDDLEDELDDCEQDLDDFDGFKPF